MQAWGGGGLAGERAMGGMCCLSCGAWSSCTLAYFVCAPPPTFPPTPLRSMGCLSLGTFTQIDKSTNLVDALGVVPTDVQFVEAKCRHCAACNVATEFCSACFTGYFRGADKLCTTCADGYGMELSDPTMTCNLCEAGQCQWVTGWTGSWVWHYAWAGGP